MRNEQSIGFWEFTKRNVRESSAEFFRPLMSISRRSKRIVTQQTPRDQQTTSAPEVLAAGLTKEQREALAKRGREQWEDFVERGKNLVNDQTSRLSAAIDEGHEAHSRSREQK